MGALWQVGFRVAFFVAFVVVVVGLVTVDHMRGDEVMAEAGDELDAECAAEEACDEDPRGYLWGEAASDEVVLGSREHAVKRGEDHHPGTQAEGSGEERLAVLYPEVLHVREESDEVVHTDDAGAEDTGWEESVGVMGGEW